MFKNVYNKISVPHRFIELMEMIKILCRSAPYTYNSFTGILFCIFNVGEEWQNKWLLEKRWQSASTEQLIRGMNDINDHVRLTAVASCSRAVARKQRKKNDRSFG